MLPYSADLRERVLAAALKGDTTEQAVADRFGVSRSFVQKMKRLYRASGSAAPLATRRGPKPRLSDADRTALARWIQEAPGATGADLAARFAVERGVSVSRATVSRVLLAEGLRRQKKAVGARTGPHEPARKHQTPKTARRPTSGRPGASARGAALASGNLSIRIGDVLGWVWPQA